MLVKYTYKPCFCLYIIRPYYTDYNIYNTRTYSKVCVVLELISLDNVYTTKSPIKINNNGATSFRNICISECCLNVEYRVDRATACVCVCIDNIHRAS